MGIVGRGNDLAGPQVRNSFTAMHFVAVLVLLLKVR